MDNLHEIFIPPYLQNLGYNQIPILQMLGDRAVLVNETHIDFAATWSEWRGILEYMCCIEYAHSKLIALPKGSMLGSVDTVPARYHSVSIVSYAQSMLDAIAFWVKGNFPVKINRTLYSFHKDEFQRGLIGIDDRFVGVINEYSDFISKLNNYRMEWVHRITGGAFIGADKEPGHPDSNLRLVIPIDPKINMHNSDHVEYLRRVNECRSQNGGEWLLPIEDFADMIRDNSKNFVLALLIVFLDLKRN